jgi:flagellar biogenesis protein FliO
MLAASIGVAQTTLAVAPGECVDGQCRIEPSGPLVSAPPAPLLSFRKSDAAGGNPLRTAAELPTQTPEPAPLYGSPPAPAPVAALHNDPQVRVAAAEAPVAAHEHAAAAATPPESSPAAAPLAPTTSYDADDRRLPRQSSGRGDDSPRASARVKSSLDAVFGQFKSLSSAGGGLAIVIGLFVACMWLLRRGGPKSSGVLPAEAFAVLGRAPLTAQSFAQLVRIGNKLVLVAMSADGAQPLAEVTDPAEVDRIAGLCMSGGKGGSSAEFQQVLAQLSREPARGFLGREGSAARRR